MKLKGALIKPGDLSAAQKEQMYKLMARYYRNADKARFLDDLFEKDKVEILFDEEGTVRGFTTLKTLDGPEQGIKAVFSGDTIIDEAFRGELEIVKVWYKFVLEEKAKHPHARFYWFLISKGYRTYKLMPSFLKNFYPCCNEPTPPDMKRLTDWFAGQRYGADYDPTSGIIRYAGLYDTFADADVKRDDPHTQYFVKANPRFAEGDELACLASLEDDNLSNFCKRFIV